MLLDQLLATLCLLETIKDDNTKLHRSTAVPARRLHAHGCLSTDDAKKRSRHGARTIMMSAHIPDMDDAC